MAEHTILVIEDNRDLAYQLRMRLEAKGYMVHTALTGNEGLNKARELYPDLILLDLMLPDVDGYKICRMLKFDQEYEHIPVIILSARTMDDDRELAAEMGANAYLFKPVDWKELFATIQTYLNPAPAAETENESRTGNDDVTHSHSN